MKSTSIACCAVALLMLCVALARADEPAAPEAGKKGQFQVTFTERSPVSTPKEIAKRLGEKQTPKDYDIKQSPFVMYVPDNYDSATPHALFVYLGYNDTTEVPPEWKPIFDRTHTIYITDAKFVDDNFTGMAKGIDALHNVKKLYAIDEKKVYVASFKMWGQLLAFFYSEQFTRPIYIVSPKFWRPVKVTGQNSVWSAEFPHPGGPSYALAKMHRHVIINREDAKANVQDMYKAFVQEGLTTKMIETAVEDTHYPNMKGKWLEESMTFFDAAPADNAKGATANRSPVTSPTSKPVATTSDAARQLSAAKSYISAKRYDLARTKLKAIVDQYPNDPAAKEARTLLEQIKNEK